MPDLTDALIVCTPDNVYYVIPAEALEQFRVPPEQVPQLEEALGVAGEVTGFANSIAYINAVTSSSAATSGQPAGGSLADQKRAELDRLLKQQQAR